MAKRTKRTVVKRTKPAVARLTEPIVAERSEPIVAERTEPPVARPTNPTVAKSTKSPLPDFHTTRGALIVWALLICSTLYVCYFSHLGVLGFLGPDEPRYAWIARDMVESHD